MVKNGLFLLANKIRKLREQKGITQTELARLLGLTRSSINSWEMGLSVPSTPFIVEIAKVFNVSTDYLLGLETNASLNISGLSEKEVAVITNLVDCLKNNNSMT